MTSNNARRYGIVWLTLLPVILVSSIAHADDVCSGSVTGSVLAPLHKPIVVSVVTPVNEMANPALVQRFLDGVKAVGVTVANSGPGNAVLDMTISVSPPNADGSGVAAGPYKGFGWMSGEPTSGRAAPRLLGSALSLDVEVTDVASKSLAWIGSLKCTVRGDDPAALAEGLGKIVGRSLGNSIDKRSF
jgi:hypothetical protein